MGQFINWDRDLFFSVEESSGIDGKNMNQEFEAATYRGWLEEDWSMRMDETLSWTSMDLCPWDAELAQEVHYFL